MTGGVLALDLSLTTGWAYGLAGRAPICGVWALPGMADLGRCYAALGSELADALLIHRPALVLMEAPLDKQQTSARLLLGLAAHVESTCYHWSTPCREQAASTVRKAVLGRGTFPKGKVKEVVMAWCRAQGWNPPDDNAGDACVLWRFGCIQADRKRAA